MSARARRRAWSLAIAAALVTAAAPASGAARPRHLDLETARKAAGETVLADSTYRIIDSPEPLRTRRCWRSPGRVVRCSLYRFAGTPCALDGGTAAGELCIQVVARRIWLVQVEPADRPAAPGARLLRVIDTTAQEGCRTSPDGARLCE